MGNTFKRFVIFLILLIITVQSATLCCGFVVSARTNNDAVFEDIAGSVNLHAARSNVMVIPSAAAALLFRSRELPFNDETTVVYSKWLSENLSDGVYTRSKWLNDLMRAVGISEANYGSYAFSDQYLYEECDRFVAAYEHNMVYSDIHMEPYAPLTRSYLAKSVCGALGYAPRAAQCADLTDSDSEMMTLVFYGYYEPDESDCVYPDRTVTREEAQEILKKIQPVTKLSGKQILSFGDSIMYGMGNSGRGIADVAGEKLNMKVTDYSVNGASFEKLSGHDLILTQIKSAIAKGEKADIILINGGTNDLSKGKLGRMMNGRDYRAADQKTFAGSFEYALGTLKAAYPNTPIVYVRAHNMVTTDEKGEQQFGDLAIKIAQKWGVKTVDIYSDTEMNTEIKELRDRYTLYRREKGQCDSVHPNAAGYSKYYLPLTSEAIISLLIKK